MPTEDPRRDGPRRDGLRIGGWLETFPRRRQLTGRAPLVTPPPTRVPVFRPARPANPPQRSPLARAVPGFARIDDPRQVRLRIAVTCLIATAVGTATFLVLTDHRHGTVLAIEQASVGDPVTMGPISPPSSAGSTPTGTPTAIPSITGGPGGGPGIGTIPIGSGPIGAAGTTPVHEHPSGSGHPSPTAPVPTDPPAHPTRGLRIGDTVSLAVADDPGLRVRHRSFLGRVDRIGPDSSSTDHADARFAVRGAASAGCYSFESVNYPGYFLRHRNFVIHLDRVDGSSLFRLDSSFCPVVAADGSFQLRSVNYPDRYVTAYGSDLYLAQVPADRATGFAVATPY